MLNNGYTPYKVLYKNELDLKNLTVLGSYVGHFFNKIRPFLRPGISLNKINELCKTYLLNHNLDSGIMGYRGFPAYISTSLNETVAHGVPNDSFLKEGDLICLDTIFKKGKYFIDSCCTFPIGDLSLEDKYLYLKSKEVFYSVISKIGVKDKVSKIADIIVSESKKNNLKVFYQFSSHGTGFAPHEPPSIKHLQNWDNETIEDGMVFTIEPIFTIGKTDCMMLEDKSYITLDGKKSCQFEHTLGAINGKIEILSRESSFKRLSVKRELVQNRR